MSRLLFMRLLNLANRLLQRIKLMSDWAFQEKTLKTNVLSPFLRWLWRGILWFHCMYMLCSCGRWSGNDRKWLAVAVSRVCFLGFLVWSYQRPVSTRCIHLSIHHINLCAVWWSDGSWHQYRYGYMTLHFWYLFVCSIVVFRGIPQISL